MKNWININDLYDVYHKIKQQGINVVIHRLGLNKKSIIKKVWDNSDNPPINWWAIPQVRARWNQLISNNSSIKYQDYFIEKYLKNKKQLILLSPGCGTAEKEMEYAKYHQFKLIECFDMSSKRIGAAKNNAIKKNLTNMTFSINDLDKFKFKKNYYDIIVFDMILHHIKDIEGLLIKVQASLKASGLLMINEYVGPNRFQYNKEQLNEANKLLKKIPKKFRKLWNSKTVKNKIYKPGILRMFLSDPSEAINSEAIIPTLNKMFSVVEERPYGGNIIHLLLKDIAHNFLTNNSETNKWLQYLFEKENYFIAKNQNSNFMFSIYKNN
tara:strand:- start:1225 stop:2199 length:975 start_codon:yes stop_codon:yes gene_type:complete